MATIEEILNTKVDAVKEDVAHPPGTYEFEYQSAKMTETQNGLPMITFELKVVGVVNVAPDAQALFERKQGVGLDQTTFFARQVKTSNPEWTHLFDVFCLNFARKLGVADIPNNTVGQQIMQIVSGRRFTAKLTSTQSKADATKWYTNLDVNSVVVTQ